MTNINELKQEEKINLQTEEVNLEDLIILGADKKIPILIEYPKTDGTTVKAKVLVKQLTLQELDDFKVTNTDDLKEILSMLIKTIYKTNGTNFTFEELSYLPIGVLKGLFYKIFELSGMDTKELESLKDF